METEPVSSTGRLADDAIKAIEMLRNDQHHPPLSKHQTQTVINLTEKSNSLNQLPTGCGKTWPIVCFPSVLDILREKFGHEIPRETWVLYVIPLISIYHSLTVLMDELKISYQIMSAGSKTDIDKAAKIIVISPERLLNKSVMNSVLDLDWSCVSIDEPHLALEWGISKSKNQKPFREAFNKLNNLNSLGTVFEMHSATIQNKEMLYQLVGRKHSPWSTQLLVPERSNLTYFLFAGKNAPNSILQLPTIQLCLTEQEPGLTLIYVQSVQDGSDIFISILNYCEESNLIQYPARGVEPTLPVAFLHSNLSEEKKREMIVKASSNNLKILIATSAAGCGINLPVVRFIGWGLDRTTSGIIQSQGRTARNPYTGEGIVIWVHNSKLHGRRVPLESKVREVLQTGCLRNLFNGWFSHGQSFGERWNLPEYCCSLCMAACVEESNCQTCEDKLAKYKPKQILSNIPDFEKVLIDFLKSLSINEQTPVSSPNYCEESLAGEIVKHVKESQNIDELPDFLSIFTLRDSVTSKIADFVVNSVDQFLFHSSLKSPALESHCESESSELSSDSECVDQGDYFDSHSE